jgi:hypothetical protein
MRSQDLLSFYNRFEVHHLLIFLQKMLLVDLHQIDINLHESGLEISSTSYIHHDCVLWLRYAYLSVRGCPAIIPSALLLSQKSSLLES